MATPHLLLPARSEVPPGPGTDWASIIEPVARLLLSDRPYRQHGPDLLFGARGSLRVTVAGPRAGTWRDHEADASGGTLALVEHVTGRRGADARAWCADAGLIEPDRGEAIRPRARESGLRGSPVRRLPDGPGTAQQVPPAAAPTGDVAAAVLSAAVPADGTPALEYLRRRGTWTTDRPLPLTVRWLPPAAWEMLPSWTAADGREHRLRPPTDGPTRLHGPRTPCCGAVVYVLARPGGAADAAELEAVTADGQRPAERWRRSVGGKTGRAFTVPATSGPLAVVLVEGPCDALAVARLGLPDLLVRAGAGTGGMRAALVEDLPSVPVALLSDGAAGGRGAVVRLHRELRAADPARYVAVVLLRDGADPDALLRGADDCDLAEWHAERAAIVEYDGELPRPDATAAALAYLIDNRRMTR